MGIQCRVSLFKEHLFNFSSPTGVFKFLNTTIIFHYITLKYLAKYKNSTRTTYSKTNVSYFD